MTETREQKLKRFIECAPWLETDEPVDFSVCILARELFAALKDAGLAAGASDDWKARAEAAERVKQEGQQ